MSNIHERFEINVAGQDVYEALSEPERIVRSLPGVSSMYRFEDDHYRVDVGEAGRNEELDLRVTERVPPRRIAWVSSDGRWRGSIDIESLAERRSLVIVQVLDASPLANEAGAADNAATVDAALRALKQALETAAVNAMGEDEGESGESESAGHSDGGVHVRQRKPGERSAGSRWREASGDPAEDEGWRGGGRGLLKGGGDQAMAVVKSLSREMDKLWDQFMRRAAATGRGTASLTGAWVPPIETCEHGDVWRVCAEVPGVESDNLHVEIDPELLVIRGERRSAMPQGAEPRSERMYGAFVRRIPLPDGLRTEDARARLRNGVLDIRIPVAKLRRGREVPVESDDGERPA